MLQASFITLTQDYTLVEEVIRRFFSDCWKVFQSSV